MNKSIRMKPPSMIEKKTQKCDTNKKKNLANNDPETDCKTSPLCSATSGLADKKI